ncbi:MULTISPECIES: peptidoglycan bridge formation glycyltransferase FemA/FemB family protein [unclassified Sporosarcina]|uniref:lipid II:glycine glycyltransferase FemX n=1 Tax=unclassified Sporosarcina TaxID=2647733 RepID=UPI00203EBF40|nr:MULTISPECIES: peptidoglycan bridge formation glycyltransferase FemA/FemB family protein [unclassified Sporosarcina]GKV65057.1 methicillin resistance protein [Sporosarcina sp. NCCP-2331]GLB56902.1 methicillin resistance protein [Sporosarcina sp. NCCP-2378]
MPILDKTNAEDVKRYETFVRNSPTRSITQDPNWADVKDDWGNAQVYVERDGEIAAAMSLLIKSVPGGYSLLYAPRGPICDLHDKALIEELLKEADVLAKKYKAFALKMDPEQLFTEELDQLYRNAGYIVRNEGAGKEDLIQPRYNMIVKLTGEDPDSLMLKFRGRTRSKIRSSARKGVEVSYSRSDEYLKRFFEIYEEMSVRNQIAIRSYDYFVKMREAFDDLRIYIAKHEEDYLAGAITINYNGKLYYLYAGSSNTKRNLNPSYLMNYEMMLWGLEIGAEQYDLGGVFVLDSEQDGLYNFKNSFCQKDGVTEFIGEIDKVYKPFIYNMFVKVVPKIQKMKKKFQKK